MTSSLVEDGDWEVQQRIRAKGKIVGVIPESFSQDYVTNEKVKRACKGLLPNIQRLFLELQSDQDKAALADFIIDCYEQQNVAPKTRKSYVTAMIYLSRHLCHKKHFAEMTREEIFSYLNTLKKDSGSSSSNNAGFKSWINTYNHCASIIAKFYKWYTQPDLRPNERQLPPILRGLTYFHNKEKTPVKAKDLWTEENTAIFLKYCQDARLACYHMIAHDMGARPGEILALRIGDIDIRQAPSTGKWYAQLEIGRGGKTTPRTVPLIDAIPSLTEWLNKHPMGQSNPDAFIFISQENSALYRNIPLQEDSIRNIYRKMKDEILPMIRDKPKTPLDDKIKIGELLKKPFNPSFSGILHLQDWHQR